VRVSPLYINRLWIYNHPTAQAERVLAEFLAKQDLTMAAAARVAAGTEEMVMKRGTSMDAGCQVRTYYIYIYKCIYICACVYTHACIYKYIRMHTGLTYGLTRRDPRRW